MSEIGNREASENDDYLVALRNKETGVITWTSYPSKSVLERDFPKIEKYVDIVAEGISEEECIRLCHTTPDDAYTQEAFLNATGPNGLNTKLLGWELEKAGEAIMLKREK